MPITVNNFGRFKGDVHIEMRKRLIRAAIVVEREAKQLISVAGTGKRGRSSVYGYLRSKPGSPPLKQTGRLRSSVAWDLKDNETSVVGTNVDYGRFLELGTRKMAARPWLVRSLDAMRSKIVSIMTAPIR